MPKTVLLLSLALAGAPQPPLLPALLRISLSPADCKASPQTVGGADCRPAVAAAVGRCRQHGPGCCIVLAPGSYRVSCPGTYTGPYGYVFAPAAVDLSNTTGITFGGASPDSPALLFADYIGAGCPAIGATDSRDVQVQNVALDTQRLPWTDGVASSSGDGLSLFLAMTEPNRSEWNMDKYPWLGWVDHVPIIEGATSSSWDADSGVATLHFSSPRHVKNGTRLANARHFRNMPSWGVYGLRVQGFYTLDHVNLLSAGGMGIRCDLCNGTFSFLNSSVREGAGRTMSTTADGVHFMHHRGSIVMRDSVVSGTGDDCFNVHGNFIIMSDILGPDRRSARYIDETGPGWFPGLAQHLKGDRVAFFSRLTLQQIGADNMLVEGTGGFGANASLIFRDPIPAGVLRYDMLISLDRVSSLDTEGCTFNHGGRGMVISSVGVRIVNNSFHNGFGTRPTNSILFLEGGCGAYEDYTEGPFSKNILIAGNSFTTDEKGDASAAVGAEGAIQLAGCRPLGNCSHPPPAPTPPPAPGPAVSTPPGTFGPQPTGDVYNLGSRLSRYVRAVAVTLPHDLDARVGGGGNVTQLMYWDSCTGAPSVQQVSMALYEDEDGAPGARLTLAGHWFGNDQQCSTAGWRTAPVRTAVSGRAGQKLWLVHWYGQGSWNTFLTQGPQRFFLLENASGLPASLTAEKAEWHSHTAPGSGIPLRVRLGAAPPQPPEPPKPPSSPPPPLPYPPCDPGGSTQPHVKKHPDSLYPGPGRITELGQVLNQAGFTVYSNITVSFNVFAANGRFLDVGATDGIVVEGNRLQTPSSAEPQSYMRLYGSSGFDKAGIEESNVCEAAGKKVSCTVDVKTDDTDTTAQTESNTVCDVVKHGAKGDNSTINTRAFRAATAACAGVGTAAQRAVVLVPPGIFITGAFNLSSNMELRLQRGATVTAVTTLARSEFPAVAPFPSYGTCRDGPCEYVSPGVTKPAWCLARTQALVSAFFANNVAIIGEGSANESVIDGRGCFWWRLRLSGKDALPYCRPQLLNFVSSSDIEIADMTLKDPAFWNTHIWNSSRVHIHDSRFVATPADAARCSSIAPGEKIDAVNSDGIDVDSSKHVYIERVFIQAGDDAVAIKSGMNQPGQTFNVSTKNVTVRHSTLVSNDFAVGSECSGGCEDISLLDSVMSDARGSAIDVLRLKSTTGRGGFIRNILVRNVTALLLNNSVRPPDGFRCTISGGTPVTNVTIQNVHIGTAGGIAGQFIGDRKAKWKGLTLRNVSVGKSNHPSWECVNIEDGVFEDVTPAVDATGSCAKFVVKKTDMKSDDDTRTISVDYSAASTPFDFEYGVDHGPDCTVPCQKWAGGKCVTPGPVVSVAPELLKMGASLIRTHDSGVLDWPVIFPHSLSLENCTATPRTDDPSNYQWAAADEYYSKIVKSGMEVYFRLGTSWGQQQGGLPPAGVPYNRTALVDVLLHTVMHYKEGWGGGENFSGVGRQTRFWEVWNEPDSSCTYTNRAGCGRFWNRSAEDFYDVIDDTVRAIKKYDPSLQVGADGVADATIGERSTIARPHPNGFIVYPNTDIICSKIKGPCDLGTDMLVGSVTECAAQCNATTGCVAFVSWNSSNTPGTPCHCQLKRIDGPGTFDPTKTRGTYVRVANPLGPNPYSWGLIAELGKRQTPIDFFSWHGYTGNTDFYSETAAAVHAHLQAARLGHVKQHVTEWFPCILCKEQDTFAGAAAFGSTLTKMIEHRVSLATVYPACSTDEANKTGGKGWGLFDAQSVPGQALWRPLTHTYAQFGELLQSTPLQLVPVVNGLKESGFTVLAGRAAKASTVSLTLLIASQHSNFSTMALALSGLPPAFPMNYSVVLTDQSVVSSGVAHVASSGELLLPSFVLAPPAVAFVRVVSFKSDDAPRLRPTPSPPALDPPLSPFKSDDAPLELFVRYSGDLQKPSSLRTVLAMIDSARSCGYDGMLYGDVAISTLHLPGRTNATFHLNWAAVQSHAAQIGFKLNVAIFPFGYSASIFAQPGYGYQLAEPLSFRGARFKVAPDKTHLILDSLFGGLVNGGMNQHTGNILHGWQQDAPGTRTFAEAGMSCRGGTGSCLRIGPGAEDAAVWQELPVSKLSQVLVSFWAKSSDFAATQYNVEIRSLLNNGTANSTAARGRRLSWSWLNVNTTQDWAQYHFVATTWDDPAPVALFIGFEERVSGPAPAQRGSIWFDDVSVVETAFVNVLQREGAQLVAVARTADGTGARVLTQGKDFNHIEDKMYPKGLWPAYADGTSWFSCQWPARGYPDTHPIPQVTLPASTTLDAGDVVTVDYYAVLPVMGSVPSCLTHPAITKYMHESAAAVAALTPSGMLMSYDEIHIMRNDHDEASRFGTAGELLASHVANATKIARAAAANNNESAAAPRLFAWADMFNPDHNAGSGAYFLVNGTLEGAWAGIEPGIEGVTMMTWGPCNDSAPSQPGQPQCRYRAGLEFFASKGIHQFLGGYYDTHNGTQSARDEWSYQKGVRNIDGFMYTTWGSNNPQNGGHPDYTQMCQYAQELRRLSRLH